MPPVRILGAGLSGLAAAILLARRGLDVEVRDRCLTGRGRFWGGFQVFENGSEERDCLEELADLGLRPVCELIPLRSATFLDFRRTRFEASSRAPYAYMIRRGPGPGTLDTWLRDEAREAGVRLIAGSAEGGWIPAVVATGPWRADGVARELVFRTDHPDMVLTLFDPALTPSGYAYLFVQRGWGTAGVAQVRRVRELRRNAGAAFADLFRLYPMRRWDEHEHAQFMNFSLPRHLEHGGTWYIGEAAGVQDFLFGLGNRLAVRSATLVAAAVAGDGWDGARFGREVVAPMRGSIASRWLYERCGARGLGILCRVFTRGDFRRRLIALQRPGGVKDAIASVVMSAWRDPGTGRASPVAAWARRLER